MPLPLFLISVYVEFKVIWYQVFQFNTDIVPRELGCPRGVMVKVMDYGISKRVRTPVALLRSLSDKYPWERYEPPYPPSYGLNSTTTVLLGEWLWH